MAEQAYDLQIGAADWIRVQFWTDRTGITRFTVQYEIEIRGRRRGVVRFDTAHDFAHWDFLNPDGTTKHKTDLGLTFGLAFEYARRDILENWERYRRDFERELGEHE